MVEMKEMVGTVKYEDHDYIQEEIKQEITQRSMYYQVERSSSEDENKFYFIDRKDNTQEKIGLFQCLDKYLPVLKGIN